MQTHWNVIKYGDRIDIDCINSQGHILASIAININEAFVSTKSYKDIQNWHEINYAQEHFENPYYALQYALKDLPENSFSHIEELI